MDSLDNISQKVRTLNILKKKQVKTLENKLNNRPRKRFGYKTPNQLYLHKLSNQEKVSFIT
jgi:IS30 family transposase